MILFLLGALVVAGPIVYVVGPKVIIAAFKAKFASTPAS